MNEDLMAKMRLLGKSCVNCTNGYIYAGDDGGKCGSGFKSTKYGNSDIPESGVCGFWSFMDPTTKKLLVRNKTENYDSSEDNITKGQIFDAAYMLDQLEKLDDEKLNDILNDNNNRRIVKD